MDIDMSYVPKQVIPAHTGSMHTYRAAKGGRGLTHSPSFPPSLFALACLLFFCGRSLHWEASRPLYIHLFHTRLHSTISTSTMSTHYFYSTFCCVSLSLYTYNIKAIFGASFRQYQMVKFFMNEHADIVSCIIWLKHMKTLTWNLLGASWALTVGEVFHCIICTGLSLSTKRKFLYATWISAPSS